MYISDTSINSIKMILFMSDQRKKCPKPPEDNSRGRKKRRQETSVQERNDSVCRRKRVRISTEHKPSDSSSDVINIETNQIKEYFNTARY